MQQSCVPATALIFLFFDAEALVFLALKCNEKAMNNLSNINHKSVKNGPNIDQKSAKLKVWRALGQVWRPLGQSWSWAIQSVFRGILDRLGGVLEPSWRGLGGSWAVLSRERWPTWFQLGPQSGAQIN